MTVYVSVEIKNTFYGLFCRLISQEKKDCGLTEKNPYDTFNARMESGDKYKSLCFARDKLSDEKSTYTGMLQRISGW